MYEVYVITCSVTGLKYVGYTGQGLKRRFAQHLSDAWRSYNTALGDAIRLHGEAAFSFEVVWSGDVHADACDEEIRLIAELGTMTPSGYNITPGGKGVRRSRRVYVKTGPRGPMSPEVREKIRRSKLGRPRSEETKRKLREVNLGKTIPPETREKIRAAGLNRKHSLATREKMSRVQRGRKVRADTVAKLKLALTGRTRNSDSTAKQIETWTLKRMVSSLERSYNVGVMM